MKYPSPFQLHSMMKLPLVEELIDTILAENLKLKTQNLWLKNLTGA